MAIRNNFKHTIYACYIGFITQAIVNNLPTLLLVTFQESFGIPLEQITVIISLNFLIQLATDYICGRVVDNIGYRQCAVAAHLFSVAGLVGMAVLPYIIPSAFVGLLISVVLYAIGGGIIEVLMSPIVEASPVENKTGILGLLHSFYCWGTVAVILISTLFFAVFGKGNWEILAILWSIVPILNAIYFTQVPIMALTEKGEGMTFKELFKSKLFWLFVILMAVAGAGEQGMTQWSSAFAEMGLGVSKTVGDLAGPCMYSLLMGCARTFYGKCGDRVNLLNVIAGSACLTVAAYCVASLSSNSIISLIACALCGLSVGIFWPGILSVASKAFPKGGTALFALLALAGDLGCSSGPAAIGFVSGLLGDDLKKGIIVGAVFPFVLVMCILVYKLISRKDKKSAE